VAKREKAPERPISRKCGALGQTYGTKSTVERMFTG
jgi:hypothetical protein